MISRAHINTNVFWLFTCNPSTCEVEMKNPQANLAGLISQVCELQIQVLDHHQWTASGEWPWKTTNINLWLLQLLTNAGTGTGAHTFKSMHTHTHKTVLVLFISIHNFLNSGYDIALLGSWDTESQAEVLSYLKHSKSEAISDPVKIIVPILYCCLPAMLVPALEDAVQRKTASSAPTLNL